MIYFFILGNNPTLSIAEIISVLSDEIKKENIKNISPHAFIVKINKKINLPSLQKQLGGTIKIGQIVNEFHINEIEQSTPSVVKSILSLLDLNSKKVFFGFSIYGGYINIKKLALRVKKKLKQQNISSRWVTAQKNVLSSVIIQKNKLLTQGAEFVLFVYKNRIRLGKTLSCQEFEKYSFYDFNRPHRAIEKGMMPPKLAKIMINFSQINKKANILDPFCGSGTILGQALLMGYTKVIGTDIDEKAVVNSQKNVQWIIKKSKLKNQKEKLQIKIQKCDVKNLNKDIVPQSVDAVITEPYLGPLRFKISDLRFQIDALSHLYINVFKSFKNILKPDGKIVIIFPVFKISDDMSMRSLEIPSLATDENKLSSAGSLGIIKNKLHFLPILDKLKESGWEIQAPFPEYLLKSHTINLTKRNSIIYSRPDQKLLREILIFTL